MLAIANINTVYLRQVHDRILMDDAFVGIRFLTSALRRPLSLVCTNWRKSMRSYLMPTTRVSILTWCLRSIFTSLTLIQPITMVFRLLYSNEAWFELFHDRRTNADVTIGSRLEGGSLYGDPPIRPTATQQADPSHMPVLCAHRVAASDPETDLAAV
jgi:hypothetical protein